jgi:hypothetical protein
MVRKWTGVCSLFLLLDHKVIAQRVIVLLEQEALVAVIAEVASAAETTVEVTEADTNPLAYKNRRALLGGFCITLLAQALWL